MRDFKLDLANILKENIEDMTIEEILELIEIPPNKDMGDYAFPCFKLAKVFRKAPNMIAQDLSENIDKKDLIKEIKPLGGYLNFFVNKELLVKEVLNDVFSKKEKYGHNSIGEGKNVVVEFSSPNIAKPFHIGHIRTTVIGNVINNIYKANGFNTIAINHLGDYGTQFGKLIVAIKRWGDLDVIKQNPIPELLKLYIKFHEVAQNEPSLEDEARNWFLKLEQNDKEAYDLWSYIKEVSLLEFNKVYDLLGIKFDSFAGESFYSDKMPAVIDEMNEKNILKDSQGAKIVDLEEFNMPPALIQKKDGSTLYITRDIAAAIYRKQTYDFYKNIYVVGSQQKLHFEQWMKVVELMGHKWAKDCLHVQFGMVALEEGTLSTRKGKVVFLEDVLNKAIEKTKEIINVKNPNLENIEEVSKQVGVGAVLFQELYNNRIKDYVFSWEKTLSFEGETGPYVQYAHARACSVLEKAGEFDALNIDYSCISNEDSINIIKEIQRLPEVVELSMKKCEPHHISRLAVDLAKAFNKFYHDNHINVEDKNLKNARLALVKAFKDTLKNTLNLLGIEAPQKM